MVTVVNNAAMVMNKVSFAWGISSLFRRTYLRKMMSAITDEMTGVFANTGAAFREIHPYLFFTTVRRDALCGSVEIWSAKHCNWFRN